MVVYCGGGGICCDDGFVDCMSEGSLCEGN